MMRAIVSRGLRCVAVAAVVSGLGACAKNQRATGLDELPVYPADKPQLEVLNVQVIRDTDTISLTNTTARTFDQVTIWLNQEFSYALDGIEVGQTVQISLSSFRNHYGAGFRAGGFFATQRPKNVVLAQIETDPSSEGLLGLIVVNGRARR